MISTKGRYAIRILLDLAEHRGGFVPVRQIAERQELLRSCGFRYFTTFQKGKPDFRPL